MGKISLNITYSEAVESETAIRKGITNIPNPEQITAMKLLAEKVFQPLRTFIDKPIRVNSFFRCTALNVAVGGSSSSQHCKGEAIDIKATGGVTNKQLFDYILYNLDFDQLIWEYGTDENPQWVHVSFTGKRKNRKQVLRAVKGQGYKAF